MPGKGNVPCFVYATFKNQLYIHHSINLPCVESASLLPVMEKRQSTHHLLDKLGLDGRFRSFLLGNSKGRLGMSPCLESQGCRLIPLSCLLFFCLVLLLFWSCHFSIFQMVHSPDFYSNIFGEEFFFFCMDLV